MALGLGWFTGWNNPGAVHMAYGVPIDRPSLWEQVDLKNGHPAGP